MNCFFLFVEICVQETCEQFRCKGCHGLCACMYRLKQTDPSLDPIKHLKVDERGWYVSDHEPDSGCQAPNTWGATVWGPTVIRISKDSGGLQSNIRISKKSGSLQSGGLQP